MNLYFTVIHWNMNIIIARDILMYEFVQLLCTSNFYISRYVLVILDYTKHNSIF